MASINKVILLGRLGKDPEQRFTPSGDSVVNFSIATSKRLKDKAEKTEWHNIVIFGKKSEPAAQYLKKGSEVLVEGEIQTRKWTTKDGQDRYTTEIIADSWQFGNNRRDDKEQEVTHSQDDQDIDGDIPFN